MNYFYKFTAFCFFLSYLPEHQALGTAGGLYHYRDQIQAGSPAGFFVFNADVCCNFPLREIMSFHAEVTPADGITIVATEVLLRGMNVFVASLLVFIVDFFFYAVL